jgi:hypothetical protein
MKLYPLSHNKGRTCPFGHMVSVIRANTCDPPFVALRISLNQRLGNNWRSIIAANKLGVPNGSYASTLASAYEISRCQVLLVQSHVSCTAYDISAYLCKLTDTEFQDHLI